MKIPDSILKTMSATACRLAVSATVMSAAGGVAPHPDTTVDTNLAATVAPPSSDLAASPARTVKAKATPTPAPTPAPRFRDPCPACGLG